MSGEGRGSFYIRSGGEGRRGGGKFTYPIYLQFYLCKCVHIFTKDRLYAVPNPTCSNKIMNK